jgi:cell wall-associated NlpC family hydrolase
MLLAACSSNAPISKPVALAQPSASAFFNPTADDVLFRAIGLVGTPYVWGGNTPSSGFDCSGLIGFVYNDVAGIRLPRTTAQMMQMQGQHVPRNQLRSGDIVFFNTASHGRVSHAGIYVGNGRFVHAPSSGGTVRLDSVDNIYWNKAYLQAKRVLSSETLVVNP